MTRNGCAGGNGCDSKHAGVGAGKLRREIGALWRPKLVLRLTYDALML